MATRANPVLTSPHLRVLIELGLDGSLPLQLRQPYYDEVMGDRPRGFWRLGERTLNTRAINRGLAGSVAHGVYASSGVTKQEPGAIRDDADFAVTLNGTTGNVVIPATGLLLGDSFSIEAWVKTTTVDDDTIIAGTVTGSARLRISSLAGVVAGGVRGSADYVINQVPLTDGVWHHVVWTKLGPVTHLYVDGVEDTFIVDTIPTVIPPTSGEWRIGSASSSDWLTGSVDEVAIYDYPLPADRVAAHYECGSGLGGDVLGAGPWLLSTEDVLVPELVCGQRARAGYTTYQRTIRALHPLAYWRLSERDGSTLLDESGWGRHLTVVGSPTMGVPGALIEDGDAGFYTAADGYATGGDIAAFEFSDAMEFTLCGWVFITASTTSGTVMCKRITGTTYPFEITYSSVTGRLTFERNSAGTSFSLFATPPAGQWSFFCISRHNGYVHFYLNGGLASRAADALSGAFSDVAGFAIGARANGSNKCSNLAIDEVAILPVALMHTEAERLYLSGYWRWNALFEGRLTEVPTIVRATTSEFGGLQSIESLAFRIDNHDGYLDETWSREWKDKRVVGHIYDALTGALHRNAFVGALSAMPHGHLVVDCVAVSDDLSFLKRPVPVDTVDASFSRVPADGSGGAPMTRGWGYGERIPGLYVRARIVIEDEAFHDYVFGKGNYGIIRLWQKDTVIGQDVEANGVVPFVRLLREYAQQGEFETAVRFFERQAGESGELFPITADLIAVYPPLTESSLIDIKFLSDFLDDAGSHHLYVEDIGVHANSMTIGNLVAGPQGVGLGAVRFDGATWGPWLAIGNAVDLKVQQFTLGAWVYIRGGIVADNKPFVLGPGGGWGLRWDVDTTTATVAHVGGFFQTSAGTFAWTSTVPIDTWVYVTIVYDGLDPTAANPAKFYLYIDGVLVAIDNSANVLPLVYTDGVPGYVGIEPTAGQTLNGDLGYLHFAAEAWSAAAIRDAHQRMHRSFVPAMRDFLVRECGREVHGGTFDLVAREAALLPVQRQRCDAWITDLVEVRTVLEAFGVFLDARLTRTWRDQLALEWGRDRTWDYYRVVLDDAPVAHWPLDETTSRLTLDRSGNDLDGVRNMGGTATTGKVGGGQAFALSIAAQFLFTADMFPSLLFCVLGNEAFSVEWWANVTDVTDDRMLLWIGNDTGGITYLQIHYVITTGALRVSYPVPGVGLSTVSFMLAGYTGVMTHFGLVVSDQRRTLSLYVNGVLSSTVAGAGVMDVPDDGVAVEMTIAQKGSVSADIFKGTLDDLAIYDYPVSAERFVRHVEAADNHGEPLIDVSLGVGGHWNNIVEVVRRERASTDVAIDTLPVAFRPRRDNTGRFETYQHILPFPVGVTGGLGPEVPLPFVIEPATADYLGAWRAFWTRQRDEGLTLLLGHEMREALPGHIAQVTIPDTIVPSYGTDKRYLIERVTSQGARHEAVLTPMGTFEYRLPNYPLALLQWAPRFYYRCNEPATTDGELPLIALDESGHLYDGDYLNAVQTDWPGALNGDPNRAIHLNGGSYLRRVAHAQQTLGTQALWFSCWFQTVSTDDQAFFNLTTAASDYFLFWISGSGNVVFHLGQTSLFTLTHPTVNNDGLWHHLMIMHPNDGATPTIMWVDGVPADRAAITQKNHSTAASTWYFGTQGGTALPFSGALDEIAVGVGAVADMPSDEDVLELYRIGRGEQDVRVFPVIGVARDEGFSLDIGSTPRIRVSAGPDYSTDPGVTGLTGGTHSRATAMAIDIELGHVETLVPASEGFRNRFDTIVGGTRVQAVAANNGDTSYIASAKAFEEEEWFRLAASGVRHASFLRSLAVEADIRVASGSYAMQLLLSVGGITVATPLLLGSETSYTLKSKEWLELPGTRAAPTAIRTWQLSDLLTAQVGIRKVLGADFRVTRLNLIVTSIFREPRNFSRVRIWRTTTATPPSINDAPIIDTTTLTGIPDPHLPNAGFTLGDVYYWAQVFDAAARPSPMIGPTLITITA